MEKIACPICGSSECRVEIVPGINPSCYFVNCKTLDYQFSIEHDTFQEKDPTLSNKFFSLILIHFLENPRKSSTTMKTDWFFFYEPDFGKVESCQEHHVNLAEIMIDFPSTIIERLDRSLLSLSKLYPTIGDIFTNDFDSVLLQRILLCTTDNPEDEAAEILNYLTVLNYIEGDNYNKITLDGWLKVEELSKKQNEANQGFIAMSYSDEAKYIMDAFREAILSSGYKAQIMSEKEHNQQIVPEMFYEIERSKFMVVDVTYPNFGAYYEAGYAQALGKEVIVCCNESTFKEQKSKPHFDIAQKPIIDWKDIDDLKQRLKRRIEATVH